MKEENVVLSSPLAGEDVRRTGEGYIKENTYLNPLIGFECYRTQNHFPRQGGSQTAGGFTLIELLVVVLIIGILAAVALPQYQKVVEKSRAAEAITLLNGVYQAYQHYYLANGQAPTQLNELSVEIPWTGNTKWQGVGSNLAHGSNENWDLALYDNSEHSLTGVCVGRISGNYSGGGFCKFITNAHNLENDRLYCVERSVRGFILEGPIGRYCIKLFKGNYKVSQNMRIYEMP